MKSMGLTNSHTKTAPGECKVPKLNVTNRNDFAEHQEKAISQTEKPEDQSTVAAEQEYEAAKLYAWSQALSLEDTQCFASSADPQHKSSAVKALENC